MYGLPGSNSGQEGCATSYLVWSATGKEREGQEELQGQRERKGEDRKI